MALVVFRGRSLLFRVADDDVGDGAVVRDEAPLLFGSRHYRVEIDIRFVALIVFAFSTNANFDEIEAGNRLRSFVDRVHRLRAGDVHFQPKRRLVADGLEAEDVAVGNLHQISFRRDKRLLPFDGETDLAVLHDPPGAVVRMKLPGRLHAGSHGNIVGVEQLVAGDGFAPVGLALVFGYQFGQKTNRLVVSRRSSGLRGHGGPGELLTLLSGKNWEQSYQTSHGEHGFPHSHSRRLLSDALVTISSRCGGVNRRELARLTFLFRIHAAVSAGKQI